MAYDNLKKLYFFQKSAATVEYFDLDGAAATVLTFKPPSNEKMWVYGFGVRFMTAVTANGFNTTAPVMACSYDAADAGSPVEKSTHTTALNVAKAIGVEEMGTDFAPFLVNGANGDALEFSIKTQGAGQTSTGEATPFVLSYSDHSLDGV